MTMLEICKECHGQGERPKPYVSRAIIERCPKCAGSGLVPETQRDTTT